MTPAARIDRAYRLRSHLLAARYRKGGITPGGYAMAQNQITHEALEAYKAHNLTPPAPATVRAS
jgi:hypothetical protein